VSTYQQPKSYLVYFKSHTHNLAFQRKMNINSLIPFPLHSLVHRLSASFPSNSNAYFLLLKATVKSPNWVNQSSLSRDTGYPELPCRACRTDRSACNQDTFERQGLARATENDQVPNSRILTTLDLNAIEPSPTTPQVRICPLDLLSTLFHTNLILINHYSSSNISPLAFGMIV
jgi:hypothetical protein